MCSHHFSAHYLLISRFLDAAPYTGKTLFRHCNSTIPRGLYSHNKAFVEIDTLVLFKRFGRHAITMWPHECLKEATWCGGKRMSSYVSDENRKTAVKKYSECNEVTLPGGWIGEISCLNSCRSIQKSSNLNRFYPA